MMAPAGTWYPAMVTSGPLLPWSMDGGRECRYLCASCAQDNVHSEQFVTFPPGVLTPPRALDLPCYGAALDAGHGLERVPSHLYVLAELEPPPSDPPGGGQGGDGGAPRSGA